VGIVRKQGARDGRSDLLMGRTLPASEAAERAVLAAILLNNEVFTLVGDVLASNDFNNKVHQVVYQSFLDLAKQGKAIDVVSVQDILASRQQLESVGGVSYLLELQEDIPALGLVEQHARIIKDKAVLRSLIGAATTIIRSCYDEECDDLEKVLDKAEKSVFNISQRASRPTFVQLSVVLKQTFQRLSTTKASQNGVTGIPSGFGKFDYMTSGLQRGDLVILAARPSMGKTALMLNMAVNAAKEGYKIGIFSLEMSAEQLLLRIKRFVMQRSLLTSGLG
jgi:replicative DNA helicase